MVLNDGRQSFDAAQDGGFLVVGRCKQIVWREKRTKVRIVYQNEWLQVFLESPHGENRWPPREHVHRELVPNSYMSQLARLCVAPGAPWEGLLFRGYSCDWLSLWLTVIVICLRAN